MNVDNKKVINFFFIQWKIGQENYNSVNYVKLKAKNQVTNKWYLTDVSLCSI